MIVTSAKALKSISLCVVYYELQEKRFQENKCVSKVGTSKIGFHPVSAKLRVSF
jgi:hypothetical protein